MTTGSSGRIIEASQTADAKAPLKQKYTTNDRCANCSTSGSGHIRIEFKFHSGGFPWRKKILAPAMARGK